jgi:hypothetical protein
MWSEGGSSLGTRSVDMEVRRKEAMGKIFLRLVLCYLFSCVAEKVRSSLLSRAARVFLRVPVSSSI